MKNPTVENQEKTEDQKSNIKPSERVLTNIDWVQEILKFLPARTVITNYSQVNRAFYAAYKRLINTPAKESEFYHRLKTEEKEQIDEPLAQLNALFFDTPGEYHTILTVRELFEDSIFTLIPNPHTIKLENPEDIQYAKRVTNELIGNTRQKLGTNCIDYNLLSTMFTLINLGIGAPLLAKGIIDSKPLYCGISTPFFFFALLTLIYIYRKYKRIQTLNKAAESFAGPLTTYGTFLERLNQQTDPLIRQPLLLEQEEQDDKKESSIPTSSQ